MPVYNVTTGQLAYKPPTTTTTGPTPPPSLTAAAGNVIKPPGSAPAPAASAPAAAPTPVSNPTAEYGNMLGVSGNNATEIANNIVAGTPKAAQISNPYQTQDDQYLAMLKNRVNGLTPGELTAEQEQGLSGIDRQTAQELERYGSIAGANGVQGGARASLMGKALQDDNVNRAALQRQLIMDNTAAKDRALQAYGGALSNATNTGLGISQYNAGATDRDTGLALGMRFNVLSGIQGQGAQDATNQTNADATQIARDYINKQGQTTSAAPNQLDAGAKYSISQSTKALDDLSAQVGKNGPNAAPHEMDTALADIRESVANQYPDEPDATRRQYVLQQFHDWLVKAGIMNAQGGPGDGMIGVIPYLSGLLQKI